MNRADRAKQFMPFAALKGYEEALREKERVTHPRIELSEDGAEMLDRKLRRISEGDLVSIRHYWKHRYINTEGTIVKILTNYRLIKLDNDIQIKFDDIADIELM